MAEPINFGFANAYQLHFDDVAKLLNIVEHNYSKRPKFSAGELIIRLVGPNTTAAMATAATLVDLIEGGTKILDAIMYKANPPAAAGDPPRAYDNVWNFQGGEGDPADNKKMAMYAAVGLLLMVMNRGDVAGGNTNLPAFLRNDNNQLTTYEDLEGWLTTANDVRSYKLGALITSNFAAVDEALKNRLKLGIAGHKALGMAKILRPRYVAEGVNCPALEFLHQHEGNWLALHPSFNGYNIGNDIPRFTSSAIACMIRCARIAHNQGLEDMVRGSRAIQNPGEVARIEEQLAAFDETWFEQATTDRISTNLYTFGHFRFGDAPKAVPIPKTADVAARRAAIGAQGAPWNRMNIHGAAP